MTALRALWPHNFNPAWPNSQVYMRLTAAAVRRHRVEVEPLYLGNLRRPGSIIQARRMVASAATGFDVVHAQYGSACGLAAAAARGVPRVLSIRGNDWATFDDSFGFYYVHTRLARLMTRIALPHYDCVLAVSNRVSGDIRRVTTARVRLETIPSPLDLEMFTPGDRAAAKAALGGATADERWVLFNALNLDDSVKRYPLARAAFEIADRRTGGRLRLKVATGLRHEDVPQLVKACDVILCTSETEGWPNSIKEALACDVPFVSTDVSDLADIAAVEPSCRICPPDEQVLATALCEVLAGPPPSDLRRHVVPMGLDASGRRLADLYRSLTAASPGGAGR